MVLATLATCAMANLSPMAESSFKPTFDSNVEYVLVTRKRLNHVYDAYLYVTTLDGYYVVLLASKDEKDNVVGWTYLPFKIAKKIFHDLKYHKEEYLTKFENY
jgi:hypothetical protein